MLSKFYWVTSAGAMAMFMLSGLSGWTLGNDKRQKLSPSARSAPGGYRSFHFWHAGIRGGK